MTYLFFAISLILWWRLRTRCNQIETLAADPGVTRAEFSSLTRRVFELERAAMPPAPAPAAEPAHSPEPEPIPTPEPIVAAAPLFTPEVRPAPITPVAPSPEPAPLPSFIEPPAAPAPALAARLRTLLGNDEWEALVGGSLLNKAGAVVLVIGIALFLAYSFQHTEPLGRAAISIAASFALLGVGIWAERHARYTTFARGLIGAGWAALYATSYAIYAIPAARIIDNPIVGSILTVAVALVMTGHSLRYRAQAATAVAYSAVFAALAVTPSSPFAVASLIPIAISILFLSARFDWNWLPLFGLIATYLTCISRGESGAPLYQVQSLFLAYWLIFELFDLRRVKHARVSGGAEFIFPLNAIGFLGLSYLAWTAHAPSSLWLASACGAALYLASSIARALLAPPNSDRDLLERFRLGSFEASLTLAAVLAAMAIIGRATGVWTAATLALEAEALYLAGLRFNSGFIRKLAVAAFALSLWHTISGDLPFAHTVILGYAFRAWTPVLAFHAGLFYLNRTLRGSQLFSYAATALIAIALFDAPEPYWGMALALYGFALLEFGLASRLSEFRAQAYGLLAAGSLFATVYVLSNPHATWAGLAVTLAVIYAAALRPRFTAFADVAEAKLLDSGASAVVACLASVLLWRTVRLDYLALAWSALALIGFELGALRLPNGLRRCLGPGMLLAIIGLLTTHPDVTKYPPVSESLTYFGLTLFTWLAAAQFTLFPPAEARAWERTSLRDILAAVGLASAFAGLWLITPEAYVSIAWLALAVAFFEAGRVLRVESARPLALCAAGAVYLHVFFWDLSDFFLSMGIAHRMISVPLVVAGLYWLWYRMPESLIKRALFWAPVVPAVCLAIAQSRFENAALTLAIMALALQLAGQRFALPDANRQALGVATLAFLVALADTIDPARLAISIPTAACLFGLQFLARRTQAERAAMFYSILGALLTAALLYGRVSGGLLSVSWSLEAFALLAAGFLTRDRTLRLQGLALFFVCILKLFLYDLRNLETGYRILSFIALGLILLSVSWIYTRFREHVAKLL